MRAGLAATPESNDFTSAQDRSVATLARRQLAAAPDAAPAPTPAQEEIVAQAHQAANRDRWLVAFAPSDEKPAPTTAATWLTGIDEITYLQLLDWTGRDIRADKRGHIPAGLRPGAQSVDFADQPVEEAAVAGDVFRQCLDFEIETFEDWPQAKKLAWLHGIRAARLLYSEATWSSPHSRLKVNQPDRQRPRPRPTPECAEVRFLRHEEASRSGRPSPFRETFPWPRSR